MVPDGIRLLFAVQLCPRRYLRGFGVTESRYACCRSGHLDTVIHSRLG